MNYGTIVFSKKFLAILNETVSRQGYDFSSGDIFINFKNRDYSPQKGGYHPVEIMISDGKIQYITDYCYFGPYDELVKELDFDFSYGLFQQLGFGQAREYPINEGKELFKLWERNFCHYFRLGVYDTIKVSS